MTDPLPKTMCGVQLTGFGGLDRLVYREDIPVPEPHDDEVLIQVSAAGINNTDINTRIGWYDSEVTSGTTTDGAQDGMGAGTGDWDAGLSFPLIQGADVVGRIVASGNSVGSARLGQRVVCDPHVLGSGDPLQSRFLGAHFNGGFAQFVAVPDRNVYSVPDSVDLSDEQLATLPCSGGTAMNMLLMASVGEGDLMLVTGASGGVGTFLVELGCHLGADVVALAGKSKLEQVAALGTLAAIDRNSPDPLTAIHTATGGRPLSVVADVVGGERFSDYLSLLANGGRYVTAGAIAGPIVSLDLRTLYLKSLSFYGSSTYRRDTFARLMDIVAAGGIRPLVDSVRPLAGMADAQLAFLDKKHVGSMVLTPPPLCA